MLSAEEAGRLEHYGILPTCESHLHFSGKEAAQLTRTGAVRWVGGKDTCVQSPVSMVTLVRVKQWQPVPTAGLLGLRVWGLARS